MLAARHHPAVSRPVRQAQKWLARYDVRLLVGTVAVVLFFLVSAYAVVALSNAGQRPTAVGQIDVAEPAPDPVEGSVGEEPVIPKPKVVEKAIPVVRQPDPVVPDARPAARRGDKGAAPAEDKKADLSKVTDPVQRRAAVRDAIAHAWNGYKTIAFGHDEILPLSRSYSDNWGGLAWSIVDSLGTLHLAGLMDQFNEARDYVSTFEFRKAVPVSVFETGIRILGGLLSAYELSGDYMFVEKARQVGDGLLPAFKTVSGLPATKVDLVSGSHMTGWSGSSVVLSEFGTLQLEFSHLSHVTGDSRYMSAAINVYNVINSRTDGGLLPTLFDVHSGRPANDQLTMGAMADSYYEYLLKLYIMSERSFATVLPMYIEAIDGMVDRLVIEWVDPVTNTERARLVQRDNGMVSDRMEHLACFVPGMLVLGAKYGEDNRVPELLSRKKRHMDLAAKLTATCVSMYTMNPSGLPAEYIEFDRSNNARVSQDRRYLLRPETVESLFIMWRVTKDPQYREQGWKIFQAIEQHCRTDVAYAAIQDVTVPSAPQMDNMESFLIAETFKYLLLLFSPPTLIPLDQFVFTTEAHPLRIMKRSRIALPA
ncbi:alpha-1,2-Mannosidase [Plasmodiophora brassicae]